MRKNQKNKLLYVLPFVIPILFILWWYISTIDNQSYLPTPEAVWVVIKKYISNGKLLSNILTSARRGFLGFLIGGIIGFALGIACGMFRYAEKLLNTPIQMVRNVPFLALMPLILIWFGIGEWAKIVLVALGVFFPIYLDTHHGIRYIDVKLLEMSRTYGMSRLEVFTNIIFPGALPSILVGVRQSLGRMWMTLIVAETVASNSGLGYMITNAREYMRLDIIVMGIIVYALLGIGSDMVANFLERHLLRWRSETERR